MKIKKFKGAGGFELIGALVVSVGIVSIIVYSINQIIPVNQRIEVGSIVRKYEFNMQQQGYLSSDLKQKLIDELKARGCKNITVEATERKVKYGENVEIKVKYDTQVTRIGLSKALFPQFIKETKPVEIIKSTASTPS